MFLLGASYSSGSKSSSSGSSGRSYSSGSSFRSSGSSFSSSSKSYSSPSSSKSYSSSPSKPISVNKPSSVPTKRFDSKASAAKEVSNSKAVFNEAKAKENHSWFNFPKKEAPKAEPQVQKNKQETFYRKYYYDTTPRTVEIRNHHYQHDNYSPFFWMWLMERSADERAAFAYNHREDMDKERYADLLKKDAALEQKVKELEAKNVKPDPNYKPQGIDNDLMYQPPIAVEKKEEGINPAWWLLILIPLAGGLFWVWKKF